MPQVFLVPITGPDGKHRAQGEPVPDDWDADYVKSLKQGGAVGSQKAWDDIAERNRVEAEARAAEPPLPTYGQAEQQAQREYDALLRQVRALEEAGVDVSAVELPEPPPPPPQVPDAVREAARAVLGAPASGAEKAAGRLREIVEREAKTAPQVEAIANARHALAGRIQAGGDQ